MGDGFFTLSLISTLHSFVMHAQSLLMLYLPSNDCIITMTLSERGCPASGVQTGASAEVCRLGLLSTCM